MTLSGTGNPDYPCPRIRVALIARDKSGRILLLNHVRSHGTYWVLPGGGVDFGENVADALAREVKEELGVGLKVGKLVAVGELILGGNPPLRHVLDFFFTGILESEEEFIVVADEGIAEARWVRSQHFDSMIILPPEIVKVLRTVAHNKAPQFTYLGRYKIHQ